MRLLALTGVVLVALVGAGSAQALSEPQSTLLRSLSQAELKALIADIDAQGLNTSGSSNVKTGVGRMQLAAGRLANLRYMGSVGIGSYVVWKIAESAGLGGFVYRKITGDPYGGSLSGLVGVEWRCVGAGFSCPVTSVSSGSVTATSGWQLEGDTGSGGFRTACNPLDDAGCAGISNRALELSQVAAAAHAISPVTLLSPAATTCGSGVTCALVTRTDAAMERAVQIEPSDETTYNATAAGQQRVGGTNDETISDPELEAALDAIDPTPGTTGTAVEQETAEAILDELDPGWDHEFITLLQPQVNETYANYVTRLQDAGWLGDATSTVLASVNDAYGPEAVVRLTYTQAGTTTVRTLDPLQWPSSAPQIELNDDIAIRYNPDTAAPAPTEGTGTGTQVTWPGTSVPSAPAVDFTPITDIDFGCRFPYGFLCYAVDFSEQFDVAADAPVFTFDMEMDVTLGSFDLGTYAVDLEVMDDWMALWRDILSVVMVVGAIYFVATRMLGFKAGGDPGAAMDDVL